MRIREPGKVCERIWFLGREESGVYLLEGENGSMMVSGGLSYILPEVLEQFERFGIDENRIQKILILHSHFDHVGIIPFFKASPSKNRDLCLPKSLGDFADGESHSDH